MYRSRSPTIRSSNYTPYKDAPPASRVINRPRRSVVSTRSPRRSTVVEETTTRSRSPRTLKTRKIRTSGSRARRATRNIETIDMIDYGDAYNTPDAYYVKEGNYGKVYRCPKPKQNLSHINEDQTLGGVQWYPPSLAAPYSTFNAACKRTPQSSYHTRVIPWDHKRKDFVYGAVQDACFKGFYDRRSLKSRVDLNRKYSSWDPVTCYNYIFAALMALLIIGLLVFLICMVIYWNDFYHRSQWPWWIFWLVVFIALIVTFICVFRCGANARTKKRFQRINEACVDINKKNLHGTGTYVYPGDSAAWLEVEMDPRRTMISGPIRHDKLSRGFEQDVHVVERKPVTHKKIVEEVVVNGANGTINDIQRDRYTSVVPNQINEPLGYSRVGGDSVYKSNYSEMRGSARGINESTISTTSKQMSFYQKLKAKKQAERNSEFQSYATPVNAQPNSVNSIGMGYSSNTPQQL